jgi:hypothetical protein
MNPPLTLLPCSSSGRQFVPDYNLAPAPSGGISEVSTARCAERANEAEAQRGELKNSRGVSITEITSGRLSWAQAFGGRNPLLSDDRRRQRRRALLSPKSLCSKAVAGAFSCGTGELLVVNVGGREIGDQIRPWNYVDGVELTLVAHGRPA